MDRHAYRRARAELIELLAEVDPMGLVEMGTPKDEYAPEAGDLLRFQAPSHGDVRAVFVRWFEEPIDLDSAATIAREIPAIRSRHGVT